MPDTGNVKDCLELPPTIFFDFYVKKRDLTNLFDYMSLSVSGKEVGWGEVGRFLTFSAFRMGANSRLGAYSNKYGILAQTLNFMVIKKL